MQLSLRYAPQNLIGFGRSCRLNIPPLLSHGRKGGIHICPSILSLERITLHLVQTPDWVSGSASLVRDCCSRAHPDFRRSVCECVYQLSVYRWHFHMSIVKRNLVLSLFLAPQCAVTSTRYLLAGKQSACRVINYSLHGEFIIWSMFTQQHIFSKKTMAASVRCLWRSTSNL